jgi:uncharacterized protein YbjT (DUF2867 family)
MFAPQKKKRMSKLFLVGGTGGLGIEIAKGLIKADFDERIALVQASSPSEKMDQLKAYGWTVIVVDFDNHNDLQAAFSGVTVVVSTVSGMSFQHI